MRFGVGGERLTPCKLDNAEITPNEMPSVNAIDWSGSTDVLKEDLPPAVLSSILLIFIFMKLFSLYHF